MRKDFRSQSAMEYMMSYGWAILIVAIILAALFGLGIFNGSSLTPSACVGQAGFFCENPLLAPNGVYTVTIASAKPITIIGIGCTAGSVAPTTWSAPSWQDPNLGYNIEETVSFQCPLSSSVIGTPFHGTLWVETTTGSYEFAAVSATVTCIAAGCAPPATTTTISQAVWFNVINTNTTYLIAGGFQQMITFNPSSTDFSSVVAPDLGNVRFYQGNQELYSWCESGCSSSSNRAVFWVVLSGGIAASSNVAVTPIFGLKSEEYDSPTGHAGECPLCSVSSGHNYGQFDNGNVVFSFYDNFSGTGLKPDWTTESDYTGSVSNGLVFSSNNYGPAAYVPYSTTGNVIIETDMLSTYPAGGYSITYGVSTVTTGCNGYCLDVAINGNQDVIYYGGNNDGGPNYTHRGVYDVYGMTWYNFPPTGSYLRLALDVNYGDATDYSYALSSPVTFSAKLPQQTFTNIDLSAYPGYSTWDMTWIRVRNCPPAEIMPTVVQVG